MEPVPGPQGLSSVGARAQRWLLGPEGGQAFVECGLSSPSVCPRAGPWVNCQLPTLRPPLPSCRQKLCLVPGSKVPALSDSHALTQA